MSTHGGNIQDPTVKIVNNESEITHKKYFNDYFGYDVFLRMKTLKPWEQKYSFFYDIVDDEIGIKPFVTYLENTKKLFESIDNKNAGDIEKYLKSDIFPFIHKLVRKDNTVFEMSAFSEYVTSDKDFVNSNPKLIALFLKKFENFQDISYQSTTDFLMNTAMTIIFNNYSFEFVRQAIPSFFISKYHCIEAINYGDYEKFIFSYSILPIQRKEKFNAWMGQEHTIITFMIEKIFYDKYLDKYEKQLDGVVKIFKWYVQKLNIYFNTKDEEYERFIQCLMTIKKLNKYQVEIFEIIQQRKNLF